ncbi:MAG: hypothetical protein ACREFM_11705 [Hypericibacter sp.]
MNPKAGNKRKHFDSPSFPLRRAICVFINCPFDVDFEDSFYAIAFGIVCCGFVPRCAFESRRDADPRMERIVRAIKGSKYSIHDLSRCRGDGDENLARFNMPLELGMAMVERFSTSVDARRHDRLPLVLRGHVYRRFVSDLSGYDPAGHDGNPESVVAAVMQWLATRPDAEHCPAPQEVVAALPGFQAARRQLRQKWLGNEPWMDLVELAIAVGSERGLIPAGISGPSAPP